MGGSGDNLEEHGEVWKKKVNRRREERERKAGYF
jgi:hypothetical protein